jgi:hypothetical protein
MMLSKINAKIIVSFYQKLRKNTTKITYTTSNAITTMVDLLTMTTEDKQNLDSYLPNTQVSRTEFDGLRGALPTIRSAARKLFVSCKRRKT